MTIQLNSILGHKNLKNVKYYIVSGNGEGILEEKHFSDIYQYKDEILTIYQIE